MSDATSTLAGAGLRPLTVIVSQGQSQNPAKRQLEQQVIEQLAERAELNVLVVPNLYDLNAGGRTITELRGLEGDLIVLAWLYERATHWILDRHGIHGIRGEVELREDADSDEEETAAEEDSKQPAASDEKTRVIESRPAPQRTIYCLDLRIRPDASAFVAEVLRIAQQHWSEAELKQWIQGTPRADQMQRYLSGGQPAASAAATKLPVQIEEEPGRRWYPVIDYSRCTNCMECIDFCLFGVYGVDRVETILVEQPDNCRKGCPACSRVCPENAIIFPQHKTATIAGAAAEAGGSLKIDLSQLFGAPSAVEVAARERDEQLIAAGRDAVGLSVGIPKRQTQKTTGPRDKFDNLLDKLDALDL